MRQMTANQSHSPPQSIRNSSCLPKFDLEEMRNGDENGDSDDHEAAARRARHIATLEKIPDYLVATDIRMADLRCNLPKFRTTFLF